MTDHITILLVEDNVEQARLTQHVLKRNEVCGDIFIVRDGQEAMDYLCRKNRYADEGKSPRPHLVLLDLNLPQIDGKEVLRLMKSDETLKDIPVIIVSASDREEDVNEVYEIGAAGYISKSKSFESFNHAIAAVHGRVGKHKHRARLPA